MLFGHSPWILFLFSLWLFPRMIKLLAACICPYWRGIFFKMVAFTFFPNYFFPFRFEKHFNFSSIHAWHLQAILLWVEVPRQDNYIFFFPLVALLVHWGSPWVEWRLSVYIHHYSVQKKHKWSYDNTTVKYKGQYSACFCLSTICP